jgi:hypothetical protein
MQQLENWVWSNLLWEAVSLLFIAIFIKFFPGIFKAFKVSWEVLKDNRETFGNGYGKHTADRFINIWYSNPAKPLIYKSIRRICIATGTGQIERSMEEDDETLIKLGLVSVDDLKNQKFVLPVLNWKNKFVAVLVKFYLIHFTGDSKKYYEDLEKTI